MQILKFQVLDVPDGAVPEPVNTLIRYVVPTVKPAPPGVLAVFKLSVAVFVPLTQANEFAFNVATVQEVVLKICNRGLSSIAVPILLNVIVG
jgi:hypothetical protein